MTEFVQMDRRDALKALIAISATGALAACKDGGSTEGKAKPARKAAAKLNAGQMALLGALAQTIIPKTDTAGAVEAGVPAVVADLYENWGDDAYRSYWSDGLKDLDAHFKKEGGQAFADMSAKQQANLLGKYDAKAYGEDGFGGFYKDMKSTVATAYYMSEPGATEELAYEAVPGEWIGCRPLSEQPKTWAT
jgi:hypothetical protein